MIHRLLLSGPMVRAVLAGQKSQTRRLVTPRNTLPDGSPRVNVGDEIWFRETTTTPIDGCTVYRADGLWPAFRGWTPSILCPDSAVRLKHIVTSVRKQKAGEIDEHDARLEGMAGLTLEDLVGISSRRKVMCTVGCEYGRKTRLYAECDDAIQHAWESASADFRFRVAFSLMHGPDALDRDVWVYGWNEEVLTEWPATVPEGRWRYQTGVDAWVCGRFIQPSREMIESTPAKVIWESVVFQEDNGRLWHRHGFDVGETFVRLEDEK